MSFAVVRQPFRSRTLRWSAQLGAWFTWPFRLLRTGARAALFAFERTYVRDFEVWYFVDDAATRRMLATLDEALDCVERFAPRTHCLLRRYRLRFAISASGQARYWSELKIIVLNPRLLQTGSPVLVAAAIVGIATLARIERMGVRRRRENHGRLWTLCSVAEVQFLERLPADEDRNAALYAVRLRAGVDQQDHGLAESLRILRNGWEENGVPRWMIRVVDAAVKRAARSKR